ncbi:hypothetical protein QBC35DRAFT_525303 [Podospora australis]|uniref:Aminoglycoside phosphotransferase domain-containing protein n=1 Tax=Podospora australis TaxID=1536484 RepID=A0AAN7ADT8_9PEZI|nr:hypothetical protein QBC35DRAFT_525303 [Podospora australis]
MSEMHPNLLNKAIKHGEVLWELHGKYVLAIGEAAVVKISHGPVDSDIIGNLHYINTYAPQVPTPTLLRALTSGNRTYLFMTMAAGVTLESIWPELSSLQKLSVQSQLNEILSVLRSNKVPDTTPLAGRVAPRIGTFTHGTCRDTRRLQRVANGPICNESEFNDFCSDQMKSTTSWVRMIRSLMKDGHRVVRTHGDLHPRNIMVEWVLQENKASDYWEFVNVLSTVDPKSPGLADWCDYLPTEAIGSWPVEFSLDCLISRWLG